MRIMERMRTKLLVMLAALLVVLTSAAMAASYPFTGVIKDDTNMRSTASSYASNIIRRIPEGDYVTVTGETGNFYRVTYDGKTGYVFKQYVEETSQTVNTGTGLTATGYPYTTISTDSVNLRKTASTSAARLTTIPKGATITVHKLSGSWANVTYSGKTGWVVKDYIQVATIVTPTTPPTTGNNGNIYEDVVIGPTTYVKLQNGSDGEQVQALQEALIELGYLRGTADGIYGSGTASAVMAFQRKNGYPVTGYADANLQALIFSGKPLNSSGKKTDVKTLPMIDGLNVKSGDKGIIVRKIQQELKQKGYLTGTITGTFDTKTVTAVKAFQQKNGLKADGVAGTETQKLLFGSGMTSSATPTPTPKPTPTPVPPMVKPASTVRSGSKGADAKLVQQRLIALGYLTGKADGKFGSQSVAALKSFQRKNGLQADGVAGSGTNAVLFSYNAIAANASAATPTPTPAPATPTPTPTPITKDNVVVIKRGTVGSAVLRLQLRLEELGYYTSSKDSMCEYDDEVAIRLFQEKNGLAQDGIAGYDTQVRLYSDSAIMYDGRLAGSLTVAYETLKKGMSGEAVKSMQARLVELGYLTGTPDGVFGTSTAEAVYYFQKNNGLVRDSIAGADTLKKLFSTSAVPYQAASTATPKPTTPPATIPTGTLKQGDANISVKLMQQKLISLGYLSGTADGVFGTQTYRALKEFQKANALYADGIAGSQTITALNNAGSNTGSSGNTGNTGSNDTGLGTGIVAMARSVKYEYWYSTVRNACRKYPYCTLFDPDSGISWQVHMFSYGKHAEIEPLTVNDTEKMYKAVGYQKWTPKPVWVIFADGTIRIATTHSVPHEVQHRTDNNFPGHACLHFPRTMAQVTSIGPYATKHQNAVDKAWAELQASLN